MTTNHRNQLLLLYISLFILMCLYKPQLVIAQDLASQKAILKIKAVSDSTNHNFAPERVHLQLDRPYYALSDTIWFKAWVINAPTFLLSAKSGLLHVDIATDSNVVIKQYLFPIQNGVAWGNIDLSDKLFKSGTYTLRAYTNWMRNFNDGNFFYQRISIANAHDDSWLINSKISQPDANRTSLQAVLQFSNLDRSPLTNKPINLKLMSGRKTIYSQKLNTDLYGALDINFEHPRQAGALTIVAENDNKDKWVEIPIINNQPSNTDLQFLPEGGNLVADRPAHIGFKAVGEDGLGADVSGIIIDSRGRQVSTFKTLHNGMGSFDLDVKAGEDYIAKMNLPGGAVETIPMPAVKASGTVLQVKYNFGHDSLDVSITASNNVLQQHANYFLIAKARNVVCYAAVVDFKNESKVQRLISKRLFPSGITHFILTDATGRPLNERLVFIDQKDNLQLSIVPSKIKLSPKDSIALDLTVIDDNGQPVAGNFTMAATDDALVKADTLGNNNIIMGLLLNAAELKGYVEDPGYYFRQQSAATWQALDNLLLTQGWRSYGDADDQPIKFMAESNYSIKGTVTNIFNKPLKNTKVMLLSKSPVIVADTLTNAGGHFVFDKLPAIDTPLFVLKAVNKSGKSFNLGIAVDEFVPPVFTAAAMPRIKPWYVNSNDTLISYVKKNISLQKELQSLPANTRLLQQVTITAKKIVKDSKNLNGPGNADQVFDEKDLEKAGKKNLFQMIEEQVTGFREGSVTIKGGRITWYFIKSKWVIVLVDGVEVSQKTPLVYYHDLRKYLQSLSAEDVKGLEVNVSSRYASEYMRKNGYSMYYDPTIVDFAFIEVTTRSGGGPQQTYTPGIYLHKPLALSMPKQFYKPRYMATDIKQNEYRPTIHWEPNIITDANGRATVKFNVGQKPSTYTIITQGIDFNGNLGYKYFKIDVTAPLPAVKEEKTKK